jgi:transposase
VRSALVWAQARAMAADGVSQREIARRLGINRRTVKRMLESAEPPSYRRAAQGSKVDRFEPVIRATLEECPDIKAPRMTDILRDDYGYEGSVDVVKRRLRALRAPKERPAQRTGYRPGQVLQLDWLELPTRPRVAGRERRVYALLGILPYSAAQSAHFSFDMTAESFLEGHVRIFDWLGGVPRECVYRPRGRSLTAAHHPGRTGPRGPRHDHHDHQQLAVRRRLPAPRQRAAQR